MNAVVLVGTIVIWRQIVQIQQEVSNVDVLVDSVETELKVTVQVNSLYLIALFNLDVQNF